MHVLRFGVCVLVAASMVSTAAAGQGWRRSAHLTGDVTVDDNLFLLDREHRPRLANPLASDVASGRYRDMEHASDLIATPALEVGARGDGLGGRPLRVSAEIAYELNLRNAARRHSEIRLAIEQRIRKGGELRLTADWRPTYFHKNYLADAFDADGDDNIAPAERIYERGESHEVDLALRYRQRLAQPVTAGLAAGYLSRRYDAPFAGRGRSGPDLRGDVEVRLGPALRLDIGYSIASLSGDPAPAVLILDETAFGVDFNGNLSTADTSARAGVAVDYSRVERELEAAVQGEAGAAVVTVAYARRARSFGSTQPYDVVNRDRHDVLSEITAEAEVKIGAGARLMLGLRRGSQSTNRGGDPASTGDVADYTRHRLWAGLRYRF